MSLLQFILIISSLLIFIFSIDAYQRKKVNLLHFIVFIWWTWIILLFSFDVNLLNRFWKFFWLTRGADLLVYISIIWLWYLYFEILNRITKSSYNFSRLISAQTIDKISKQDLKNKISSFTSKDNTKNKYLFLIRAWNEEYSIWKVIDEIIWAWYKKILIVNDGSTDNTFDIVNNKISQYNDSFIIQISHLVNRWGWCANKTWFEFIKKYFEILDVDRVVTYDADWQMNIKDMLNFENVLNNWKYDILLGSRFVKWASVLNIPLFRRIVLFGSKIVTYVFGGIWVSDPHNWYRLISVNTIKNLKIYSDWMTYSSEIIDEIKRLKLKFNEVPVNIVYTEYSLSKWQKNSNAFKILAEIIYKKFFFK